VRSPAVELVRIMTIVAAIQVDASAASWTDISSGLTGQAQGVRALAIDGSGAALYAVGTAQAFKSTDGGSNWRMLGGLTGAEVLVPDPVSPSTVYAGSSHGVWKSIDGGETWAFAGLPATYVTTVVIDPLTPSTLYAGALDSDQVYRSTDGGASWTGSSVGFSDPSDVGVASILIDPTTPSRLYVMAVGAGSPLYKSTDGAQTWSVISNDPFFRLLAITPSTLYAILGGPLGLSTSTDGGATWTSTGFPGDVLSMAFDPANSAIVYGSISAPVGSPPALYKSIDAGHNWTALNANMPFAGPLVLNPSNPSVIYGASYSGGVFRSSDAGRTWSAVNNGLGAASIHVLAGDPSDPSTVYAGGDGGLFKRTASGENWTLLGTFEATGAPPPGFPPPVTGFPSPAPASVDSMLIDGKNPGTLYIGTGRIGGCFLTDVLLYKSVDAGSTWSDSINPNQSGCSSDTLLAIDPTDSGTLYIASGDDYDFYGVRKTTDGGASWTYTGFYSNVLYAMAIDAAHASTLYAGTDDGIVRSTDGGATWTALGLANMNVNLLANDPSQPNTLYAAAMAVYPATSGILGIFKSTDGGTSWLPINRGLADIIANHAPVNALIVDPGQTSVVYLAASGYGVFRTVDGGAMWTPLNDGLTNLDVRALAITGGSASSVYAGTPGGIFRIADDPPEPQPAKRHPGR
jgi:photosystem II stability/assembly factor-like uncharacterized protein